VVESLAAKLGLQDTRLVQLEDRAVSLDGNRDGLLVDGGEEGGLVVLGDVSVAGDGGSGLAAGRALAGGATAGGVRVVLLGADTVLLDPLEGVVHETTVATLVAGGAAAGDEVLLGEGDELAVLDEVVTLNTDDGGEGPAGTALALVLDRGDGAEGDPVLGVVGFIGQLLEGVVEVALAVEGGVLVSHTQVGVVEVISLHVRELVVAEGDGGGVISVVLLDDGVVLLEGGEGGITLVVSGVLLVELVDEGHEAGLDLDGGVVKVDSVLLCGGGSEDGGEGGDGELHVERLGSWGVVGNE